VAAAEPCITTTTGDHLQFDSSAQFNVGVPPVWPLTVHEDVFGNAIEVTYLSGGRIDTITDTWNRTVSFSYSTCGPRRCLDSITAAGTGGSRTVTYTYTSFPVPEAGGSRSFLTGVQPAAGPGYTYGYGTSVPVPQNRYALSSIAYPFGGATTYTYSTWSFFTGREDVPMAAVATRRTSGRALPTATWSYEYEAPRTKDVQTTTVTRPDLSKDVYEFVGFGFPARILATGTSGRWACRPRRATRMAPRSRSSRGRRAPPSPPRTSQRRSMATARVRPGSGTPSSSRPS
jgi:hypothetical protein